MVPEGHVIHVEVKDSSMLVHIRIDQENRSYIPTLKGDAGCIKDIYPISRLLQGCLL